MTSSEQAVDGCFIVVVGSILQMDNGGIRIDIGLQPYRCLRTFELFVDCHKSDFSESVA